MNIKLIPYTLINQGGFRIAHGIRHTTETLIVELEKDGIIGYGEAAHVPYYGILVEETIAAIELAESEILSYKGKDYTEFWERVKSLIPKNHYAQCALDMAFHDLIAKTQNISIARNLGLKQESAIESSFTIGISSPEEMTEKAVLSPFETLKIKLGSENDVDIINALRAGTNKTLRVDANAGWKKEEAISLALLMQSRNIEFIEQPFAKDNLQDMRIFEDIITIPFIADESCFGESDVEKCASYFDGINIKLTKCGGLTPGLRMAKKARELGMKVMLGCMSESSIGISAMAQLISMADYADLDGALLINNDPAEGVKIDNGEVIFSTRNGHGAILK